MNQETEDSVPPDVLPPLLVLTTALVAFLCLIAERVSLPWLEALPAPSPWLLVVWSELAMIALLGPLLRGPRGVLGALVLAMVGLPLESLCMAGTAGGIEVGRLAVARCVLLAVAMLVAEVRDQEWLGERLVVCAGGMLVFGLVALAKILQHVGCPVVVVNAVELLSPQSALSRPEPTLALLGWVGPVLLLALALRTWSMRRGGRR